MATNLVNNRPGTVIQQSKLLDQYLEEYVDDLGGGILPSFPVLSIRGGKWRVRFRGEETLVTDDRGYPKPDIDVVIINSPRHKSKAFYAQGYNEDDPGISPTCWSSDGKVPDASVPEDQLQNDVCATCPRDKIGSRVTDAGKKTKECGDHKRVVVVPASDILNEAFGGVMLLRVPASSLKGLQAYGDYLKSNRVLYFGCATVLTFDPDPSFPRIQFEFARPLDDTEVQMVLELRETDQVKRILNEEIAVTDPSTAEVINEPEDTPESSAQSEVVQPQRAQPQVHMVPQATQRPVQPQQPRPATPPAATPTKPALAQPTQQTSNVRPIGAAFGGKPTATPVTRGLTTKPISTINSAVAKPATPPVSTRTVAQPQRVVQPPQQEMFPEETVGIVPDELDEKFGKLMS